jgi:hypothetical protein
MVKIHAYTVPSCRRMEQESGRHATDMRSSGELRLKFTRLHQVRRKRREVDVVGGGGG